jgi:hypothetical protein
MSQTAFQKARQLVDEAIRQSGESVTTEERNWRVQAVEHQLRHGKIPNPASKLKKISIDLPRSAPKQN